MKRLIVCAFSILLLLTGCNATDDTTDEKVSAEEETYMREITDEEKGYIQLVLDHEYEELLKQTTNNEEDILKTDYSNLASAFIKEEEINNLLQDENRDAFYDDAIFSLKYRTILRHIENVNLIPKELKSQVSKLKQLATKETKEYTEKRDKERAKIEVERKVEQKEQQINSSTKNPQPVTIGMTTEEVLTKGWGKPNDINRTTTAYGVSEQWVYNGYKYLYFEDGILKTIQN